MPKRIQLKRSKGWRIPENCVKVDRSTKWGNPFKIGSHNSHPISGEMIFVVTRQQAIELFSLSLTTKSGEKITESARRELRGKDLACWCKEGECCHADVWIEVANAQNEPDKLRAEAEKIIGRIGEMVTMADWLWELSRLEIIVKQLAKLAKGQT